MEQILHIVANGAVPLSELVPDSSRRAKAVLKNSDGLLLQNFKRLLRFIGPAGKKSFRRIKNGNYQRLLQDFCLGGRSGFLKPIKIGAKARHLYQL